jgi:predicted 3-demethylubiquinone-9 3-methyltransferase (glyoxalase superfamily)
MTDFAVSFLVKDCAHELATFYVTLFGGTLDHVDYYGEAGPLGEGTVLAANFTLWGRPFTAINAGQDFAFTEALSLRVDCEDQAEVDKYWDALCDGGSEGQCGWLKDRFGVSWQIVPRALARYLGDPDPVRAGKAMRAMLSMTKLDVAAFEAAVAADD